MAFSGICPKSPLTLACAILPDVRAQYRVARPAAPPDPRLDTPANRQRLRAIMDAMPPGPAARADDQAPHSYALWVGPIVMPIRGTAGRDTMVGPSCARPEPPIGIGSAEAKYLTRFVQILAFCASTNRRQGGRDRYPAP